MAERSNAAVLKTVDCNRSGGSNPSFSAELKPETRVSGFLFLAIWIFCAGVNSNGVIFKFWGIKKTPKSFDLGVLKFCGR